jgi:uncharacterized protein (TIGR03905 family)
MEYTFRPRNVCPSRIDFTIDGNVIRGIRFTGGCNGNLKAIGKLLEGKTVEEIESVLRGNTCGGRPTSCADQLAIAVREAYDAQRAR